MPVILFVKARRPSHATLSLVTPDLFGNLEEREVQHRGFVDSHGHYHAPHVQTHHVAVDQPKEQPVKAPAVEAKPAPAPKAAAQPAPEPAKPAASVHPDIEAMIASLALDPSNTNAKAVDRKLEIMRELVGKGDPQAIRDANWGTNTYGKRIARKAAEIADRMEVHEVMDVVEAHHADVAEVQEGAEPGDGGAAVPSVDHAAASEVSGGRSGEQTAAEVPGQNRKASRVDYRGYEAKSPALGVRRRFYMNGEISETADPLDYGAMLKWKVLREHNISGFRKLPSSSIDRIGDKYILVTNRDTPNPDTVEISAVPTPESIEGQQGFDAAILDNSKRKIPEKYNQKSMEWRSGYEAGMETNNTVDQQVISDHRAKLRRWMSEKPEASEATPATDSVREGLSVDRKSEPQEGDTKTENGITYRLENGRWHRVTPDAESQDNSEVIQDAGQKPSAGADNGSVLPVDVGSNLRRLENTAEQPYQSEGIKISRGSDTQHAASDQLPESLSRYLRPHARDSVNLTLEKFDEGYRSFLVADGTGAGKTRQALATASMLLQKHPDKPILIVTQNARVVSDAFGKDAAAMGILIQPVDTLAEIGGPGIYVTTYTRVGRGDLDGGKFGTLMFDESHNLKNYDAAKSEKARALLKAADRSLLLTATPGDKGEQIGYLTQAFGMNFLSTMSALGYSKGQWGGWDLAWGVTKEQAALRVGNFFTALTKRGLMVKREVSMDNVDVTTRKITLSEQDARIMANSHDNMLEEVADAEPQRRGLTKMLGLAKLRTALEPMKVDITVETALADVRAGKQVVVFANRIENAELPSWWADEGVGENSVGTLEVLADRLEAQGLKVGRLYGKHLRKAKDTLGQFQGGTTDVVIATPQAGGTGINLDDTVGDKPRSMVVMTAPFSSLEAVQMIGRINRLTTKSRAEVRFVQASGVAVDEWNFGIIEAKLKMLGAAVQGDVAKLDLSAMEGLADEDIAAVGAHSVPVKAGPEINLDMLGLRVRRPGKPAGGAPTEAAAPLTKTYLRVPFSDKDYAKARGARWDPERRQWYVLGDVPKDLERFNEPEQESEKPASAGDDGTSKIYLSVSYSEKDYAKARGARWDSARRQWYVVGSVPDALKKFLKSMVVLFIPSFLGNRNGI